MKVFQLLPLVGLLLFSTGCAPNDGFSGNYRSIEQLQLVHTLGFDAHSKGVAVSAAGGEARGGEDSKGPGIVRLQAAGTDITAAVARLQEFAGKEELYFAHTRYVLVGAEYAETGLGDVIDYLEHSPQLRSDLPLFVVKNGSAADLIAKAGGENTSVFDLMESVVRSCAREGAGYPFTCGDIAIFSAQRGCALACALEMVPTSEVNTGAGEEELTPVAAGYAIFKDGRLAGYLSKEGARGVNLLLGQWGAEVVTPELAGSPSSLQFTDVKVELVPEFGRAGTLTGLTVAMQVEAELENRPEGDMDRLTRAFEKAVVAWMEELFQAMRATGADFMGFGDKVAIKHPEWTGQLTESVRTMALKSDVHCQLYVQEP